MAGDAEVVLNLSLPQAIRLMEAITRKVGETLSNASAQGNGGLNQAMNHNGMNQGGMNQPGMNQNQGGMNGMNPPTGMHPSLGMNPPTGMQPGGGRGMGWGDTSLGADRRRPG
ncbi:MAG: hypothetical protein ACQSGP_31000 [Frankia sp.]